jgi:hypothetical protein
MAWARHEPGRPIWAAAKATLRGFPMYAACQHIEKALAPMAGIMRFDALKKRAISLPPFVKRHMQGRLHGVCYMVDIVGIHDKGFLKFFGGSGKSRKYKHAWVLFILSCDVFFCHEVHAIAERRDKAHFTAAE